MWLAVAAQHHLQQLQVLWHIIDRQNLQGGQERGRGRGDVVRRLALRQRQLYMKFRALARGAADVDITAHHLRQLARDGGTQPRAAKAARGGCIGLCKRRKNVFDFVGSNPDACVLDAQVQRALAIAHLQAHMATLGELDSIAHQVGHDLLDAQRITLQVARHFVVYVQQ